MRPASGDRRPTDRSTAGPTRPKPARDALGTPFGTAGPARARRAARIGSGGRRCARRLRSDSAERRSRRAPSSARRDHHGQVLGGGRELTLSARLQHGDADSAARGGRGDAPEPILTGNARMLRAGAPHGTPSPPNALGASRLDQAQPASSAPATRICAQACTLQAEPRLVIDATSMTSRGSPWLLNCERVSPPPSQRPQTPSPSPTPPLPSLPAPRHCFRLRLSASSPHTPPPTASNRASAAIPRADGVSARSRARRRGRGLVTAWRRTVRRMPTPARPRQPSVMAWSVVEPHEPTKPQA